VWISFFLNTRYLLNVKTNKHYVALSQRNVASHVSSLALFSKASVKLAIGDKRRAMNHRFVGGKCVSVH